MPLRLRRTTLASSTLLLATLVPFPVATGCRSPPTPAQVVADVQAGEAVVCPELVAVPFGAQVCQAVAELVVGFVRAFAASSPENRALVDGVRTALDGGGLSRVGPYGYFPEPIASRLNEPQTRKALDAWVSAGLARDGGAK
jgi:hypothetical protein